jgi:uncharacterized membrane protein
VWNALSGIVGVGHLGGPNLASSTSYAATADGSTIIGLSGTGTGFDAFRWTNASGIVPLGFATGSAIAGSYSISGDGTVVVGYEFKQFSPGPAGINYDAVMWTPLTGVSSLAAGAGSNAFDVSLDGRVIVGGGANVPAGGFRWTAAEGVGSVGDLPGGDAISEALGVSGDGGSIVGRSESTQGSEAFRWTALTGIQGLGDLPGGKYDSTAWAASGNGLIVVGDSSSGNPLESNGYEAIIWDPVNGLRNLRDTLTRDYGLDLTGWSLVSARDISYDARTIVGYGINPDGNTEAWLARIEPVPEPSTAMLFLIAAAPLWFALRRQRQRRHRAAFAR